MRGRGEVRLGGGEGLMRRRGRGAFGQGTLEYILLIAAVLVAVLFGINTYLGGGASKIVEDSGTVITNANQKFTDGLQIK